MKCLGQSGGGAFEVAESRSKHGGRESAQGVSSGCMGHASQVIVFCTYNLDIIYIYILHQRKLAQLAHDPHGNFLFQTRCFGVPCSIASVVLFELQQVA